jgi:hypothetical protein
MENRLGVQDVFNRAPHTDRFFAPRAKILTPGMQVAVVTEFEIDDDLLKRNLPSASQYLVCRKQTGVMLYRRLCDENKIQVYRGSGFDFGDEFEKGPHTHIGSTVYVVDGVEYLIWGPGTSLEVLGLEIYLQKIDRAIRNAF